VKCPNWRRVHAERWKAFEKAPASSEFSEVEREHERQLQKKRVELARALECLDDPSLRSSLAREFRRHVAELEREIAELEGKAG
jgi:hypothetical protein